MTVAETAFSVGSNNDFTRLDDLCRWFVEQSPADCFRWASFWRLAVILCSEYGSRSDRRARRLLLINDSNQNFLTISLAAFHIMGTGIPGDPLSDLRTTGHAASPVMSIACSSFQTPSGYRVGYIEAERWRVVIHGICGSNGWSESSDIWRANWRHKGNEGSAPVPLFPPI